MAQGCCGGARADADRDADAPPGMRQEVCGVACASDDADKTMRLHTSNGKAATGIPTEGGGEISTGIGGGGGGAEAKPRDGSNGR